MGEKGIATPKRYRAMNYIRVLAFAFIIIYHYMVELEINGNYVFSHRIYYANANLHIAMIGVSLFFMISGAGLMLSSQKKWDIKEFYKHRFVKILLPYWVVEVMVLLFMYVFKREWIAGLPAVVPKYRAILNLVGLDGYLGQFIPTYYLRVGEWFLGALVLLYAVFPVFRYFMEKNRYLTMIVATAYYLVIVFGNIIPNTPWTNVFVKGYDFVLGMFLILEYKKLSDNRTLSIVLGGLSLAVIILGVVYKPQLPTPITFNNLVYAVFVFVLFFSVERIEFHNSVIDRTVNYICNISYELFLIHHFIIYYISDRIGPVYLSKKHIIILFLLEVLLMFVMAIIIKTIVKMLKKLNRGFLAEKINK